MCPHILMLACLATRLSALPPADYVNPVAGDLDFSKVVNAVDVQLVINGALGIDTFYGTDVDRNSLTNAVDVQLVINAALGIGIDTDGDGLCDSGEPNAGTLVSNPDTDGDSVCDGLEILLGTNPVVTQANFTPGASSGVVTTLLGPAGGSVSGPAGTPIEGVTVVFPANALSQSVNTSLGYDTGTLFAAEGQKGETAITLETPGFDTYGEPVTITFPYSAKKATGVIPVPYYVDEYGKLHLADLLAIDDVNHTATFDTFHPSVHTNPDKSISKRGAYTWIYAEPLLSPKADTGWDTFFLPPFDGFKIVNRGSDINQSGECMGMTSFALWYQMDHSWLEGGLYGRFNGVVGSSGLTGQHIIATRAHTSVNRHWRYNNSITFERQKTLLPEAQMATIRSALRNSDQPVLLHLYPDLLPYKTHHSVLAYAYTRSSGSVSIRIYDPNYPNDTSAARTLRLTLGDFPEWEYYQGYDSVTFDGAYGSLRLAEPYENILTDAKQNFHSSSDAILTVTSHASGDEVTESTVHITGAIQSGQVLVTHLIVMNESDVSTGTVGAGGSFSVDLPLVVGENHPVFLTYGKVVDRPPMEVTNSMRTEDFVLKRLEQPSIQGVIFDSRAQVYTPLPNATVRLRRDFVNSNVVQTATTNASGEFTFFGLTNDDTYTLWGSASGYSANMVTVTVGQSSALNAHFGLDRQFTGAELLGRWGFDIYLGASGSSAFFDLESTGGGRVNNHSDTPLEWVLDANGEFTMVWWKDTTRRESSKTFRGTITRGPGWPGANPIVDGDPVYIWGYMLNDLFPGDPPKLFKATPQ